MNEQWPEDRPGRQNGAPAAEWPEYSAAYLLMIRPGRGPGRPTAAQAQADALWRAEYRLHTFRIKAEQECIEASTKGRGQLPVFAAKSTMRAACATPASATVRCPKASARSLSGLNDATTETNIALVEDHGLTGGDRPLGRGETDLHF